MIKGNRDTKNYIYILSTTDKFEFIIEIADTQQDMANKLNIDLSSINKFFNRHETNKNIQYIKNYKLERVKIYDYVYIVYESYISSPLYVSRDLHTLSKISGFAYGPLSATLHNYNKYERKRKKEESRTHKLQGKYFVKQIDLLDLDINLSIFLESCIDKGKITKSFQDFENMEEIDVKEEN